MRKVKIYTDSTADLPKDVTEKYGITVISLYVTVGGKTYRDGVDIFAKDIFEHFANTKELPKTAAVTMADYTEAFSKDINDGYDIIHFAICSEMSSCYHNSCLVAEELGHIYPIDSKNLSTGIGLMAIAAAELAEKGEDAESIVEKINAMREKVDVSFLLGRLEFLHKGGRCSGVAALGANVLGLKPCIEVVDGKMTVGKKYRGNYDKCAVEYVKERLKDNDTIDLHRIFFTYTGISDELIETLVNDIKSYLPFEEVLISEAGSTISGHCGPGCLGILYCHK